MDSAAKEENPIKDSSRLRGQELIEIGMKNGWIKIKQEPERELPDCSTEDTGSLQPLVSDLA